jgi:lysozyme
MTIDVAPWEKWAKDMDISDAGLDFIMLNEGNREQAYQDSKGIWTIGVGHTIGVKQGDTCTFEQAMTWLRQDVAAAVACARFTIKVQLTQNMFDAIIDWIFNLGCHAWTNSTCIEFLNEGKYASCSAWMSKYIFSGNAEVMGLIARRQREATLFATPDTEKAA